MEGIRPQDAAYNTAKAEAENQDPIVDMTFATDRSKPAGATDQSLEMTFASDRDQTTEARAELAQEFGTLDESPQTEQNENLEFEWEPEIIEGYKADHPSSEDKAAA